MQEDNPSKSNNDEPYIVYPWNDVSDEFTQSVPVA